MVVKIEKIECSHFVFLKFEMKLKEDQDKYWGTLTISGGIFVLTSAKSMENFAKFVCNLHCEHIPTQTYRLIN